MSVRARHAIASATVFAILGSGFAVAQDTARRLGDVRDAEAHEKRQKMLSRMLMLRTRSLAVLEIGDGEVLAHCGKTESSHADYQALEALAAGDVAAPTHAAAIKLRTDYELEIGDVRVPAGNVAAGFPGTYSLWLKRTAAGWSLVVNGEADVWGTQRDPANDVAEVAIGHDTGEEPTDEQKIVLEETEGGGTLVLSWGTHQWSAPFRIVGR